MAFAFNIGPIGLILESSLEGAALWTLGDVSRIIRINPARSPTDLAKMDPAWVKCVVFFYIFANEIDYN